MTLDAFYTERMQQYDAFGLYNSNIFWEKPSANSL